LPLVTRGILYCRMAAPVCGAVRDIPAEASARLVGWSATLEGLARMTWVLIHTFTLQVSAI